MIIKKKIIQNKIIQNNKIKFIIQNSYNLHKES
jgi:hypothetical protein